MSKLAWLNFTQKIDEAIFNRGGRVSPDYRGARWMTILPILAGIGGGVYAFFRNDFFFVADGVSLQLQCFVLSVWFLNQLFHINHVFILPGLWRKFLYPVFVSVVTVVTLCVTMYLVYITLWIIVVIIFLLALLIASVLSPPTRTFRKNWDGTYTEI